MVYNINGKTKKEKRGLIMDQENKKCELTDCLKNLGFTKTEVESYFKYQESDNLIELKRLLSQKRKVILDEVHKYYEKLECIDYLINMIGK